MNSRGVKDALLGGRDLTTVTLLESGPWLTPSISAGGCQVNANADGSCPTTTDGQQQTNDQSNTNVANRGAVLRPDAVSTNFYAGQSRSQFFNWAAFSPTPVGAGRFGNAGVGILQGPGTAAVSLGVAKSFALRRRCMLALNLDVCSVMLLFSSINNSQHPAPRNRS
jgi:hypothetical protein